VHGEGKKKRWGWADGLGEGHRDRMLRPLSCVESTRAREGMAGVRLGVEERLGLVAVAVG
jgi:hypothetical protein